MLGTPQHRVSERSSSVAGGARPSHVVLAHLAELKKRRLHGKRCDEGNRVDKDARNNACRDLHVAAYRAVANFHVQICTLGVPVGL
jgi:hypothetical protein